MHTPPADPRLQPQDCLRKKNERWRVEKQDQVVNHGRYPQAARENNMDKRQKKIAKVMREFKAGTLHGGVDPKGPKKAPVVTSRKQAIAIALSEADSKKGPRR